MTDIKRVRGLFPKPGNQDADLILLLERFLKELNKRKKGTMIGKKKAVDYAKVLRNSNFPESMSSESKTLRKIVDTYHCVGDWSHPSMQVNVVPPPSRMSIACDALASRFNENSIWDHYGSSAALSEVMAIGMMSDLIGYDKNLSGGLFTFGGTGCNLYAARIGIEKADPNAKSKGIRKRIQFFCSDLAHYSVKSCAIWTGIGMDHVVTIPSTVSNEMRMGVLEEKLEQAVESGKKIGTIYATAGTTDAFGIDPVRRIVALRDKFQKKVRYKIHVHADAVIGWPYLSFRESDVLGNLSPRLAREVESIYKKIRAVKHADSVGIDFHKTGWAPYICSAFLVKDNRDLLLLKKSKNEMPYLYHGDGYQPGCFSLESSRPNYAQKALANMLLFGKEGYRTLLVHLLETADYLRDRLVYDPSIEVLNAANPAFVTDFRLYPFNGKNRFSRELSGRATAEQIDEINEYNRRIAKQMIEHAEEHGSSMVSYSDTYRVSRNGRGILSIKSYPMSPFVEKKHMDWLMKDILRAKSVVDGSFEPKTFPKR